MTYCTSVCHYRENLNIFASYNWTFAVKFGQDNKLNFDCSSRSGELIIYICCLLAYVESCGLVFTLELLFILHNIKLNRNCNLVIIWTQHVGICKYWSESCNKMEIKLVNTWTLNYPRLLLILQSLRQVRCWWKI